MNGRAKRNLATAVVVGLLIVVVVVVGRESTKPKVVDDSISRTFTQGEPCATADIALAVPAAADPSKTAEALFAVLEPMKGLNTATYNLKTSCIDVGYCESQTTETAVRTALQPTGLLAAADTSAGPFAE
jgi:hypothetical protein